MSVPPRPSAAVCLLRRRHDETEVLMVRRGDEARFMGGAWVFPGGTVDEVDHGDEAAAALPGVPDEDRSWKAAALRELVEEAGVWLSDPPRLLPVGDRPRGVEVFSHAVESGPPLTVAGMLLFSNWVTPTIVPVRFDARFYVVEVPATVQAEADSVEVDAAHWVTPRSAIAAADAGSFLLAFPTRRTLLAFAALGDVDAITDHARRLDVVAPIHPRLRLVEGGVLEAVLPGEEGYDQLGDEPPDPDLLERVVTVRSATGEPIPELAHGGGKARRRES